ncbi:hypothetical protein UFOVP48_31 [uncultured Caudovirales phage]|uniref:Uncharacterized protein n=1 Tax=uncultured Caudovirales phage TaxID=2100421 RepID=A0A6J5KRQ0_9CAUD|nr:hypothetical protein UFOVP48_31 [uncultured Caudovirales phage]
MSNIKVLDVPSSNPHVTSNELMNELRAVINTTKYDHMTVATVLGVLEMVKLHYWQQIE